MRPKVRTIVEVVAARYGLTAEDILMKSRATAAVRARYISYWLARALTWKTLEQIGQEFGRHYSSIQEGVASIDSARLSDRWLDNELQEIERDIERYVEALGEIKALKTSTLAVTAAQEIIPPPSRPARQPALYEPELAGFVNAYWSWQDAEYGRGERWARQQFERAAAALAKAATLPLQRKAS